MVRVALKWLVVALVALDLIGSPLHNHGHDHAVSVPGSTALFAAHADTGPGEVQVDHSDGPAFSHPVMALRGEARKLSQAPPGSAAVLATCKLLWTQAQPCALPVAWPPDACCAGAAAFRCLPPDGRAPPARA
jgi:hypothetical protein